MRHIIFFGFLSCFFQLQGVHPAVAQNRTDFFETITAAVKEGNTKSLYSYLDTNISLDLLGEVHVCSNRQAHIILRNFFADYTPKAFSIIHRSGKPPLLYGVGILAAGGERFRVTLCVHLLRNVYEIQQIKIEKEK